MLSLGVSMAESSSRAGCGVVGGSGGGDFLFLLWPFILFGGGPSSFLIGGPAGLLLGLLAVGCGG